MIGSLSWLVLLYFCLHILVARCVLYKWCYSCGVGVGTFGDILVGVILGRTYFVRPIFNPSRYVCVLCFSVSLRTLRGLSIGVLFVCFPPAVVELCQFLCVSQLNICVFE
jgi:hypothetical protein